MLLYVRMIFTMTVSLFTARVVLNTLGIEDYGIYNLVAGFVTMFGFLNSSMASATQRFLSFEIGKKNNIQLARVFSMSLNIHVIIGIVIVLLAETIGLWFLNSQLTIPSDRLVAANWVYQLSIFTFFLSVVSVPFNAIIIAHERMNVFAWVSIVEVSLKLIIVYMLYLTGYDKLVFYAVLTFVVVLIIRIVYGAYCKRFLPETKYIWFWDKPLFKTLMAFSGWSLFGNLSVVLYGQGVNILLNIFFGPVVNAARAIAYQIQGAIAGFVSNFQMAMNPQIIKSFALDDVKYMHQLIFQGARFSFFLLFMVCLPILLETEIILKLWLKNIPEYTVIFTQLVLVNILIDCLSGPLMTAANASGKVKSYQLLVGGLLLTILPISYFFLKIGYPPQVTLYVSITFSIIALILRLRIVSSLVKLSILSYITNVILRILPVVIFSLVFAFALKYLIPNDFLGLLVKLLSSFFLVVFSVFFLGITKKEKISVVKKIKIFLFSIFFNEK